MLDENVIHVISELFPSQGYDSNLSGRLSYPIHQIFFQKIHRCIVRVFKMYWKVTSKVTAEPARIETEHPPASQRKQRQTHRFRHPSPPLRQPSFNSKRFHLLQRLRLLVTQTIESFEGVQAVIDKTRITLLSSCHPELPTAFLLLVTIKRPHVPNSRNDSTTRVL